MSHFTVLVIGNNPEEQLAPFSENLEMPKYVKHTREALIAKEREEIEEYKNSTYAEYLEDPELYKSKCQNNPGHIKYLEEEFPAKLKWTDDEVYQNAIKWYEQEDLGPNGEVYSTYNPNSKWDWYLLGGRWTGFFKLKEGKSGSAGEPGIMTSPAENGMVDQAIKGDIDFEGMKKDAYDEAAKHYDKVASCFESGIIPKIERTWKDIVNDKSILSIDKKREIYNSQEGMKQLFKAQETLKARKLDKLRELIDSFFFKLDDYQVTKEEYATKAANNCLSTFAVLKDGKWYERGEMGWWGCVSDEKEKDTWTKEFMEILEQLPDDTLLSVYDCHI